jgi:hypothetical protein
MAFEKKINEFIFFLKAFSQYSIPLRGIESPLRGNVNQSVLAY